MPKAQVTELVSEQTFEGMHRVARRMDIDRGGLYDSRSGAINIWCSPGDKPVGYGYEIRRGALNYPRDYIGTIMPRRGGFGNHSIPLELQIDPERGGTEPPGRRAEPTNEEVRWARKKLDELVEMGEEEGVFEEVLICPLCGEGVETVTFNGFVRHVMGHAKVECVEMGPGGNAIRPAGGPSFIPTASGGGRESDGQISPTNFWGAVESTSVLLRKARRR